MRPQPQPQQANIGTFVICHAELPKCALVSFCQGRLRSWARAYDGPARHFAHRIRALWGGSRYRDPLHCATLFPSHHSLIFFSRRLNLTHLDVLSKVRAPPKSSPLTLQSVPDRQ